MAPMKYARTTEEVVRTMKYHTHQGQPACVIGTRLKPDEYKAVDRFIMTCGGMWDTHAAAHLFPADADAREALTHGLAVGWHERDNELDFHPTPDGAADLVVQSILNDDAIGTLNDPQYEDIYRITVLEPGAGHGALLDALFRLVPRHRVDVIAYELDPRNVAVLRAKGYEPIEADFLASEPRPVADYVIMNPPFNSDGKRNGWLLHVNHAMKWMKELGTLASVTPRLPLDVTDERQSIGRRPADMDLVDFLARLHADGTRDELPENTFRTSDKRLRSTSVATDLVTLSNPMPWKTVPQDGWNNWFTHWTYVIVSNNDWELLQKMCPTARPGVAEMMRILEEHRPAWVARFAPWVKDRVDLRQLAHNLLESQYQPEESPQTACEQDESIRTAVKSADRARGRRSPPPATPPTAHRPMVQASLF